MTRKYSSISVETTLQTGIGTSETTITAPSSSAVTLLLGGVSLSAGNVDQFTVVIDPDTASEEIVFVTGVSGANMTVVREQAGTSAVAHLSGAVIRHSLTSDDLTYYTTGVDSSVTAAGTSTFTNKTISLGSNTVTGTTAQFNTALTDNNFATLAGTETLTNKTLTTPTITSPTITTPVITFPVASVAINSQTTAYTLTATDKSKLVIVTSASTANVTVPPDVFSQGDVVYISRSGSGALSLVQGAGVTISATPGLALRAQASVAAIICTGSNTFIATGDLSA
jgi:hypothetical protein